MEGDLAPIKEMSHLIKRLLPPGIGQLFCDEAHALGVIGEEGKGLVSTLQMETEVSLRMYSFSKAMSVSGGG
jgi:8-amino-7-oxononanoate synthase